MTDSIIQWDADGYPTEESLERLRQAVQSEDIPAALQAFYGALKANSYPEYSRMERVEVNGEVIDAWAYHTCGWSGNESIIGALRDSWFFWWLLERYDAGGHYYFLHPENVPALREED